MYKIFLLGKGACLTAVRPARPFRRGVLDEVEGGGFFSITSGEQFPKEVEVLFLLLICSYLVIK
jgi:hypothetical protein